MRYSSSDQVISPLFRLHSQLPSCASFCASASSRRLSRIDSSARLRSVMSCTCPIA